MTRDEAAPCESAAYPLPVRVFAVSIVVAVAVLALDTLPTMRSVAWNFTSVCMLALAAVLIAWVGWWMVFSRTRLAGDELVQTWLWDRRVQAHEVATFKIVYWPWLRAIVSPRMLVRRRNGSITWIHAANPALLVAFGESVIRAQGTKP